MAESDKPTPVVFYCHGGGWSRGNNGVYRMLSQYMAKQKGVTGRAPSPIRWRLNQGPMYAFRSTTSWPPYNTSATTPKN